MKNKLSLENLNIKRDGKIIVKDFSLDIPAGSLHVLMGPNGSGKSTLANAILGHPDYEMTKGKIIINDEDVTDLGTSEKAKSGIFIAPQISPEIEGLRISTYLQRLVSMQQEGPLSPDEFLDKIEEINEKLALPADFLNRELNVDFSGGEKKKLELVQLMLIKPKYAILDETEAGLDAENLQLMAKVVGSSIKKGMGILLITHNLEFFKYLAPDKIHVMIDGIKVASGGTEIVDQITAAGYQPFTNNNS